MTSTHFRQENGKQGALHRALNRYIHAWMQQITQAAARNRFHDVEARLARRLLMTRDRMDTNHFRLTQELLGSMLGVLRFAVTDAAGALQRAACMARLLHRLLVSTCGPVLISWLSLRSRAASP